MVAAKPTEEVKKSDGFAIPGDPSVNLRMTDYLFAVMLSVSETPSAGRPLSGTLRVPPLPLQRESILPEGWVFAEFIILRLSPGKNFVEKIIKNFCKNLFKTLDNAYKRCYNVGSQTVRVLTLETGDC